MEQGVQSLLLPSSTSWEPPNWQIACAGNHSWDSAVYLEVEGPPHCGEGVETPAHVCLVGQVCLILGSVPGMSTSHRCKPALTSSVKKGLLSFFLNWFRTQIGKSCYLPLKSQQLKETRLIHKNFYFLPNSGLSSKSHPPFPYVFADPASLSSHTGGCKLTARQSKQPLTVSHYVKAYDVPGPGYM